MNFSQRHGYSVARKLVQIEAIDDELRSALWSVTQLIVWRKFSGPDDSYGRSTDYVRGSNFEVFTNQLWMNFYKEPVDTVPAYWGECHRQIRELYFASAWFEVYDFIEFIAAHTDSGHVSSYIDACNTKLDEENSAYRIIAGRVAPIANEQEVEEVETAIGLCSRFPGASSHLRTALGMLSDRSNPDYRNSIKESISAVESAAKIITGDHSASLGSILTRLERDYDLHQAMKTSFSAMYGYTSDADGIRHAMMDLPNINKAEARYMLIVCSAFINFIADNLK